MKRITFKLYTSLALLLHLTLAFTEDAQIKAAGEKVLLQCEGGKPDGDVTWKKDGERLIWRTRSVVNQKRNTLDPMSQRVRLLADTTLQITDTQLSDSGEYICEINRKDEKPTKLRVFEISAHPSPPDVMMTENLRLELKPSNLNLGLTVRWKGPYLEMEKDLDLSKNPLELKNMQPRHAGTYTCHIDVGGGKEKTVTKQIAVLGILPAPDIVYLSGSPVSIPWIFSFDVRESSLANGVAVKSGALYYSSDRGKGLRMLSNLTVTPNPCWPFNCTGQTPSKLKKDLSYPLPKPIGGWYRMEINLALKEREKTLYRDTCLAMITVSYTPNETLTLNSHITLTCMVSCMPGNGVLRWYRDGDESESDHHGQRGETSLEWELEVSPSSMGTWNCSLLVEGKTMANKGLVLEVTSLQDILIWAAVGGAAIFLLIAVVIITFAVARCRRRRRARYRAWLIQTLHQQRRCECDSKGFHPKRLQEEVH
uniref:Ig-like domain-containing protein n=1 Tax=Leptobrachium leishanense TaxID=445787 RepID=A0A8C5N3K3_9ANUR